MVALLQYQYVTILSVELHISSRSDFQPDPEFDEIRAVFYAVYTDTPPVDSANHSYSDHSRGKLTRDGIIMVRNSTDCGSLRQTGLCDSNVTYVETERQLISETVDLVKRQVFILIESHWLAIA